MQELEFYALADRTYRWFEPAHERDSIGIDVPNSQYDPLLGQQVLRELVDTAQRLERLGFDAVSWFEQHNTPLALVPNALTAAAFVAAKTEGIQIAPIGPILNAYASPIRLAEEIALVDTLSGGRLSVGLPMGIGAQYHSYGTMSPLTARARYREGIALLHKLWHEDGPFAWEGEHFNIPYVNPWPKPLQSPHPEIFIPAAGSRETIELAAKYDFVYQTVLTPPAILRKNMQLFRDIREENGYPDDPNKVAAVLNVYVSETDESARREYENYITWTMQNIIRFPFHESFPPGHVSEPSFRAMRKGGYRSSDPSKVDLDGMFSSGFFGSPDTVRQALADYVGEIGAGRVIVTLDAMMPTWMQDKSMTLFAEDIIPAFRRPDGLAAWQRKPKSGYQTHTELMARNPKRAGVPHISTGREYFPVSARAAN